jgi:hypothetical protein
MNKKLAVAAALVFGAAGLMLAQGTVKAQDATDNSVVANSDTVAEMNAENAAPEMNAENAAPEMNVDNAALEMNADNAAAPAAQ